MQNEFLLEDLPGIVDGLTGDSLKLLEEIVNINSYSFNVEGNNLVQDVLEREFKKLGLLVDRAPFKECGDILVATTHAAGTDDVLLLGHSDTVFPPTSPFQRMTYEGSDFVVGPGVCDMKGGLITIMLGLQALDKLGKLHDYPLRVVVNSNEETGSVYSRELFDEQVPFTKTVLVFETGRKDDLLVTSRVGSRSFLLKCYGKAAHSGSHFAQGANAINRISYIINELRQLTNLEENLTCNIGIVKGGEAVNTVPDYAEARFELRATKVKVLEDYTARANEIIQTEVIPGTRAENNIIYTTLPFERTPEIEELFKSYQKAGLKAGLKYERNEEPIRGGSDGNIFAGRGIPTIDALGPYGEGHHSIKENMRISSLKPKTLNWLYWLMEDVN